MADDVLVILQQALMKEEDRRSYYEDAAQRAANPLAQQTFTFLAQEEDKHAEYIQQFYEQMKAGQGWPDASECSEECKLEAAQVKEIFTNAREAIDGEVTSDTDLTDAYDLAMQGERDSIEFYKAQLAAASEPGAKLFYKALVDSERGHLQLLVKTQEFLDDTASWYFEEEQWGVTG